MFPHLRAANFEPQVVFDQVHVGGKPDIENLAGHLIAENYRIIVFQKVHGSGAEKLARRLSTAGIKTAFMVCDLIEPAMVAATDMTIIVTEYLKSLYPSDLQSRIRVVHDGIERPEIRKTQFRGDWGSPDRPLSAVLVTSVHLQDLPVIRSPVNWLQVRIVGRYLRPEERFSRLREMYWNYVREVTWTRRFDYTRFLLNARIHCTQWDPNRVYEEMQRADIGIIPIDTSEEDAFPPTWKVKSENRLTMKMSVGLPVIATPIPSYEGIIDHGSNGFFARSRSDWVRCLDALRDPDLRQSMGERARERVLVRYSQGEQARLLISAFEQLLGRRTESVS